MSPLLVAGHRYSALGWPVFVLSKAKVPAANCLSCQEADAAHDREACPHLTCHGFYAATTDRGRITAMLKRRPHSMLAMRTGAPSGTVVIDVDPRHGGNATLAKLEQERLLPGTLSASTGSDGLHLVYAHPGGWIPSGANRLGPGIDVKADGAYVVVAPSVHPSGGRYRWVPDDSALDHPLTPLPEHLLNRLRPVAPAAPRPLPSPPISDLRSRIGGLVDFVLRAPDGERNGRLYWAACRGGELVHAGEVDEAIVVSVLTDAAEQVGLTAHEIGNARRGTIGSGLRAGLRKAAA